MSLPVRLAPLLALALSAPRTAAPQSATRPFQLSDWYRLTTVAAPAMSPAGDRVALTVTTVREAENRRHSEVWVVPTRGGEPQRFTSPGTESSAPRWSPDGRYLLFTSTRPGGSGSSWALRVDSARGEAVPMNRFPAGSWPRDGRFIVWADSLEMERDSARAAPDSVPAVPPMARPPFGAITRPVNPSRFDGRHVIDMRYRSNDRGYLPGSPTARVYRPAQLWLQPTDGGARRQLTHTRYSHRGAVVSPDGRWIAFLADAGLRPDSVVEHERDSLAVLPYLPARDEAARNETDVFVIPVAGGAPRRVAQWVGTEAELTWSPDSRRLAFIGRAQRTASARLYVVSAGGGTPEDVLAPAFRFEPESVRWTRGDTLLFSAETGGSTGLFRLDLSHREPVRILGGRRRLAGFTYDAGAHQVAYVATDLTRPAELYVADVDGRNERRLTGFNDALLRDVAFSDAERFTFPSVGGAEIEGWLMKPYGYLPGKRYPLVLYIHGGPHSAYGENWFDEFQNLAAQGMFVLFVNPRGSTGYGAEFTYSTRGRWGREDYQDLMGAVDLAVRRPDVDSTRLGVSGGSYGGFMTAWITTRTDRFRAAEADRMISDWTYWYGASDAQALTEFEFFGKPWDNFALYDSLSPIRHVARVRTPTLIVQSEDDFRTPMGNAELWYMALKKRNVPVELVRYPRSTHELSRSGEPWLLVDRLGRLRQWFGYWLQGEGGRSTAMP